ncbi:hypothetical protein HanHA300_Chr11g0398431 [Helianthus annuus]|nr:hypothetical protein HanHA300_Chr11g0398431 [Helianthus annuus]KAJ0517129.1 hypothetical protein HanHA89_Chr11g0421761 [Helianthus annuus]KAJ0685138.1 hypothetical protein HanLR1_Chr11g0399181 [Helianthus annuus]
MAAVNKTKNIIDFVRDGSIKWLNKSQNSSHQEFDEMKRSPSAAEKNWIYELSAVANAVVRRCSKVLDVSVDHLRENFEEVASEVTKTPSRYARNFLEYSCFRALAQTTQVSGYMEDKRFRRLTFDMMLAWEVPDVASQPSIDIDEDATVGIEAFSRIAPAVPVIANVIISNYIFEFLTSSTGGRLPFSTFEKYLIGLERAVKKLKSNSESSLLLSQRSGRGERVLELEGTVTTQPVLQHLGISTWPGRLTLTDHALYFEALRVVSYDKPTVYDLADDLKQVVKAELTGPWGSRLFDKAVLYKSNALSEPVILELPELKGHARRDYWLAIVRGDRILETIATMLTSKETQKNNTKSGDGMHSVSATTMASSLGFVFGTNSNMPKQSLINVGEITVGEMTPLEKAVEESRSSYKMVADAQATVDGAKVEGLDTNLAVLKELLVPLINLGNRLLALLYWEEPAKSVVFCFIFAGIIYCGWMAYVFAFLLIFFAINMMLARHFSGGNPISELKVTVPPPMNKMEQLLAVQNAISQAEELVQEGNVILLKIHGLLLSIFPQASNRFAAALVGLALFMTIIPFKYVLLLTFLEEFTKYSPMRRAETERIMRRMREWWISIPAAPVVLERAQEDKKKK